MPLSTPRKTSRRSPAALASALSALTLLLAACGGDPSDGTPPTADTISLSGVVADGPLSKATVCLDSNDNGACDVGEPMSGETDVDGRYTLTITPAQRGRHALIANIPATAVDKDTGQAVGTAYQLKAPKTDDAEVFVSPLTTLVADAVDSRGLTPAAAVAEVQQQLGLTVSPLANFVGQTDDGSRRAATLARTVNTVMVEVTRIAAEAGLSPADVKVLVRATTSGDLSGLAAKTDNAAAGASGTPAEMLAQVATQVAQAVLEERNVTPGTVVAQAAVARTMAQAPAESRGTGRVGTLRSFTYTDAGNYSYRLFTGDSNDADSAGVIPINEMRTTVLSASSVPFNRNEVWWTGSEWKSCDSAGYRTTTSTLQTATTPARGVYCHGSKFENRIVFRDIAGVRVADVIREFRAFPLPDIGGVLPTAWGPDPALVGDAVFPAGSEMNIRETVNDVGSSDVYYLTAKPRVRPAYRHVATLEDLERMSGRFSDPAVSIGNGNALFVEDIPVTQPDTTLRPIKRFLAALEPAGDAVKFYRCDVRAGGDTTATCEFVSDGTKAISTQGGLRLMRFTSGYPTELTNRHKAQRTFVEANGVVFRGNRLLQNAVHNQRLNLVAWNAMREVLGIPAHVEPTPPAPRGGGDWLGHLTYYDTNSLSYRRFVETQASGSGSLLTLSESFDYVLQGERPTSTDMMRLMRRDDTSYWPALRTHFSRIGSFMWNGAGWIQCVNGSDAATFDRQNGHASYCDAYKSVEDEPMVVGIGGRLMTDIVRDIRWYPSQNGIISYANWGLNPDLGNGPSLLSGAVFPAGATMKYQRITDTFEPIVALEPWVWYEQVVVPPSSPSSFTWWEPQGWATAPSLGYLTSIYTGGTDGSDASFHNTLVVIDLMATDPPREGVHAMQLRVAFNATTGSARFFTSDMLTDGTRATNFVNVLSTTYTVESLDSQPVLRFAQIPASLRSTLGGADRLFVELDGRVLAATQMPLPATPRHTIQLNGVAWEALRDRLGIGQAQTQAPASTRQRPGQAKAN